MTRPPQPLDVAGVGIGPFNMSLAALLAPIRGLDSRFFDRRHEFRWHEGLMFPDATVQNSSLKDLVTLADPTSPYSFLAFLAHQKRLYRFIYASFPRVLRREYDQYLRWAAAQLPNLSWGTSVDAAELDESGPEPLFRLATGERAVQARNLVVATGLVPKVPPCAEPHLGDALFHAGEFLLRRPEIRGRRVAVIGGGQTGAELILHLLSDSDGLPQSLTWISRRSNFVPLDESPFTNEIFSPAYSKHFYTFRPEIKHRLVEEQRLASDGVSQDLLERLYRRLYALEYFEGRNQLWDLRPGTVLLTLDPQDGDGRQGWSLGLEDILARRPDTLEADLVILATGFEYRIPACLEPLLERLPRDQGRFRVGQDFSVEWDGPRECRIFMQNAARYTRGIADPNLSLMAWRSATIANSLAGRTVYDVEEADSVFDWQRIHDSSHPPEAVDPEAVGASGGLSA